MLAACSALPPNTPHSSSYTVSHALYKCSDMCHAIGCTHGFVRLVGGGNAQEGTVELCINGQWTLVGDDGWDDSDAEVVCIQMGFHYTSK